MIQQEKLNSWATWRTAGPGGTSWQGTNLSARQSEATGWNSIPDLVIADKTSSTNYGEGEKTGPSAGGSLIAEKRCNRACQR